MLGLQRMMVKYLSWDQEATIRAFCIRESAAWMLALIRVLMTQSTITTGMATQCNYVQFKHAFHQPILFEYAATLAI